MRKLSSNYLSLDNTKGTRLLVLVRILRGVHVAHIWLILPNLMVKVQFEVLSNNL